MPGDAFYKTRRWRQCRAEHLAEHPWCAVCAFIGIGTVGVDVDHVQAKELVHDPYDHDNLRTLCKLHHGQKTIATEGAHRGKKPFRVTGLDGWPVDYVGEPK